MLLLASLVLTSGASYVRVTEPYNATIANNGSMFLGKVGPGQTFFITVNSSTTNSTGYLINLGWNRLVATSIPAGWTAENSSLNRRQLSVELTPSPNAANGTYAFNLSAINTGNESRIGTLHFRVYVNVTPNVFRLNVTPTSIVSGPGEPTNLYITINNTGVSDNPFTISVQDIPAWNNTQTVIALHHTTGHFIYPIYGYTPGVYSAKVYVKSLTSPIVYKEENITYTIKASLENDYYAIGEGAVSFPIIYEPAYDVMYIIGLIARHL